MRLGPTLILALATASGCARAPAREEALMDEIELAVVLPNGARPLSSYGRSYAFLGPNLVAATYLIPPAPDADEGCEMVFGGVRSRPCTKLEVEEVAAKTAREAAGLPRAGTRHWRRRPDELPNMLDGGCNQVSLEFDATAHRFLLVTCNGPTTS